MTVRYIYIKMSGIFKLKSCPITHDIIKANKISISIVIQFFSLGATTPIGPCILQPSSGL